jgi:MerR family transcriptional regulator, copper efflux regulator
MRITEAARRLGTSARMLRYREDLGLLPRVRERPAGSRRGAAVSGRGPVSGNGAVSGPGAAVSGPGAAVSGPGAAVSGPGAAVSGRGAAHRVFTEEDLEAVAAALELERRYDISPAALAFGVRVLAEPAVRAAVADLGRRLGRIPAPASRALDFEKERALRLLQGR